MFEQRRAVPSAHVLADALHGSDKSLRDLLERREQLHVPAVPGADRGSRATPDRSLPVSGSPIAHFQGGIRTLTRCLVQSRCGGPCLKAPPGP